MTKSLLPIFLCTLMLGCQNKFGSKNTLSNTEELDTILIFENTDYPKLYAVEFAARDWNVATSIIPYEMPDELRYSASDKKRIEKTALRVKKKNAHIWKKLDSTFELDSRKRFQRNIASELSKINLGERILMSDSSVQKYLKQLYEKGEFISPVIKSKISDSNYVWQMWKIKQCDMASDNKPHATFSVDLNTNSVEIEKNHQ